MKYKDIDCIMQLNSGADVKGKHGNGNCYSIKRYNENECMDMYPLKFTSREILFDCIIVETMLTHFELPLHLNSIRIIEYCRSTGTICLLEGAKFMMCPEFYTNRNTITDDSVYCTFIMSYSFEHL